MDEFNHVDVSRWGRGHAEAAGGRDGADGLDGDSERRDLLPYPFRDTERALLRRFWEEQEELVASVAAFYVGAAQNLAQASADGGEGAVPGEVAVTVVDGLEVIEIQHEHRRRNAEATAPREFELDHFRGVRPRPAAGEVVGHAVVADLEEQLDVAHGDGQYHGRGSERALGVRVGLGRDAEHSDEAAADDHGEAGVPGVINAIGARQRGLVVRHDVARDPLERCRTVGGRGSRGVEQCLPALAGPPKHPRVASSEKRGEAEPEHVLQRFEGECLGGGLPQGHELFEVAGPGARSAGLGGRGDGVRMDVLALLVLAEEQQPCEDEEGRQQLHAVPRLHLMSDVEYEVDGRLDPDDNGKQQPGNQQAVPVTQ